MADDTIGRADYELRARIDGLKGDLAAAEAELAKSGERGESTFAQKSAKWAPAIAEGVKTGVKVVGAGAAAMFAIASKGALDLQKVQNDYQSETGASAEEAKRAGKVINQVAGENQQSLESVSAAAIAVHNDLGLVGDQADQVLASMTEFARVTKQEPVAAVKAFDDILDAWNLTAADSQKVMDALVVSHQKYGGSVADDQAALAALAPTLRAMNGTWGDAVALLDLAKASGLNTADAIAGLNHALATVKSPEELQRLIDDISATEDPFLRAQKAADLFGQKAGPKLANALAGKSLTDFRIDMDEATGATHRGAQALDEGFGAQIQKKISEVGIAIRDLGNDWGPVLTAAGGFVSVLGALGADTIVEKLGPKFVDAMKTVGTKGGDALIDAAGTATGAAGTIFGNVIADPIAAALDPDRNSLLGRLIRGSSGRLASVYLRALYAGDAIEAALSKVWGRIAGSRAVVLAVGLAGTAAGAVYGAAAGAVETLAAPIAAAWGRLISIPAVAAAYGAAGEAAGLAFAAAAAAAPVLIPIAAAEGMHQGANDALGLPSDADQAARNKRIVEMFDEAGHRAGAAFNDAAQEALGAGRDGFAAESSVAGVAAVHGFAAGVRKAVGPLGREIPADIAKAMDWRRLNALTRAQGNRNMEAYAQGINEARSKPLDAFNNLVEMLKHPLGRMREVTRLLGELTSKDLAKGLRSHDPEIRDQAIATKQFIIDRLTELAATSHKLTKEQSRLVAKGLRSHDPEIRAAARHVKELATKPLETAKDKAHADGAALTKTFAKGLIDPAALARVRENASIVAGVVADYWRGKSPPPKGPLHTIDEGGKNVTIAWAKGLVSAQQHVLSAGAALAAQLQAILRADPMAAGYAASAGYFGGPRSPWVTAGGPTATTNHYGGNVTFGDIHLHAVGSDVTPGAAKRFGQQVLDEVVRGFRDQSARTSGVPRGRP